MYSGDGGRHAIGTRLYAGRGPAGETCGRCARGSRGRPPAHRPPALSCCACLNTLSRSGLPSRKRREASRRGSRRGRRHCPRVPLNGPEFRGLRLPLAQRRTATCPLTTPGMLALLRAVPVSLRVGVVRGETAPTCWGCADARPRCVSRAVAPRTALPRTSSRITLPPPRTAQRRLLNLN